MSTKAKKSSEDLSLRKRAEELLLRSFARNSSVIRRIIFVLLVFLVSMGIVILAEHSNDFFLPHFALWESHLLTIIGIPAIVAIAAYFALRRQLKLIRDVMRENEERKKAEIELSKYHTQLVDLNSTKDKLFSIIAHDLRGPFSVILGFSELLAENLRKGDINKSMEYIEQINASAKQTLIQLENLLSWARIQTGKIYFQPENIILQTVIKEIVEPLNSSALLKNITLDYSQSDDIKVYCDENMLKTILRNLISNAIKFTNPGGKVFIQAEPNQNHTKIIVSDNGVGMSEEKLSKLFRLDAAVGTNGTANESGSGFGLILCKEFVEKNGGQIQVESEVGKGSRFIFTLPVSR